jgi:hypothetical protein
MAWATHRRWQGRDYQIGIKPSATAWASHRRWQAKYCPIGTYLDGSTAGFLKIKKGYKGSDGRQGITRAAILFQNDARPY